MTTTTLSTWASTYGVGRQHVDFSVRSSTPTTGAMTDRDAQGQWRVVRGGTIIHRENKILDFQWLGLNGDIVYARAIDAAGNAGDWESYTYVVAANTAADFVAYVDTSGNDTTGDGSEGNPWATVTKAVTEAQSALTSGQVGVIFLSDDQTWAHTATLYSGGDATSRLVRFVRKGGGTNRPLLTFAAGNNGFQVGKKGALHLEGIRIHGNHAASTSGSAINMGRSGGVAADRDPYNLMVVDCEFDEWWQDIHGSDSVGYADRDSGCLDFVALQGVTFTDAREYHVYGWNYLQRVLIAECWFGPSAIDGSGYSNPYRTFGQGRSILRDNVFETGDAGNMRFLAVASDIGAAVRFVTVVRHRHVNAAAGSTTTIGPDPGFSGAVYAHDIRFVDCRWESRVGVTLRADDSGSNGVNTERIDLLDCEAYNATVLSVNGSSSVSHTHASIRMRGCASSYNYSGSPFLTISGAASRYELDCFEIHSCAHCWNTGNLEPRTFVAAYSMTRSDLADRVFESNYNRLAKADTESTDWVLGSNGRVNLATWQSESGHDANSSVTLSSTHNWTEPGFTVPADGDFRLLSDSGPLAGTGYPIALGVAIDADGYLRSATTPDAGPYEYGATDTPDDPEISSGSAGYRSRRRMGLRRGLR